MNKAKKLLAMLLAASMMFALAACGGSDSSTAAGGDTNTEATGDDNTGSEEGGETTTADGDLVVNVNLASEPASIDPALNEAVDGAMYIHHMFEGLYGWESDGNGNAVMVPAQASSTEKVENDDGTVTYTFKIRDDALWSDGEKVTANDFEYAWKRAVDPVTASTYGYMLDMVVNANEIMDEDTMLDPEELAAVALDEETFEVTLTYDCPYFLEICAFPTAFPVRQDIIEEHGDLWTFTPETYIGNGKYKMAEWSHDEVIKTVKNENYYGYADLGPAEINYVLMDDENAMLTGFRNGELDFIEEFPVDERATLLANDEITIVDYIGTYFLCFNNDAAPFDDARVREAFALVIDRDYIVAQISQAGEQPATGWVPAGIYDADPEGDDFRTVGGDYEFYTSTDAEYEANCDRARELLAEAGYENGDGFPVTTYIYNTLDTHKAIAEALQNIWLTELGIQVSLENMDWNAFIEARNNGEFSIARHGWIADYNDPISFIDLWYSTGGNNDANYNNPAYDAAIDAAKSTADPDERMTHLHEAEDILFSDYGIAPIYFYVQKYMFNENLDGMYYTPLGYFFFDQVYEK